MNRRLWVTGALLLVALVVLGSLYGPDDDTPAPAADPSPVGYRAAFDLLAALDVPAGEHRGAPDTLPPDAAAWWIAPAVCGADPDPSAWPGRAFVEGGGTAVVLLRRQDPGAPCRLAEDLPLPPRDMVLAPRAVSIAGDLVPSERRLPRDAGLLAFQSPVADGWTVRATVQDRPDQPDPQDRPLLIERTLGAGRLLVLADAQLFRNARLDAGDTAPLLADLVRDTGVPRVVDVVGSLVVERNALAYLVRSPALAAFVGLLLVGALLAWQGTLVPPRRLVPTGMGTPTVDVFVDALAGLYARTGDWARLALRYRELTAARLRRHFGLSPETSTERLVARLERDARFRDGALDSLVVLPAVSDEAGLRALVAGLDALVARAAAS